MGIRNGWFYEEDADFPGQAFGLEIKRVLYEGRSKFQDVLVFESTTFGNVLVLDGIIQCTERDEFAYQEMIAHVPLFAHKHPERVLVIGGGDGGVLREVVKHQCVRHVTLVEIDETVISVSKKFLPHMAEGFASPKVEVVIGDGFEYLRTHQGAFDVIITDSSDPDGPAVEFFKAGYFTLLKNSLRAGGVVVSMASENVWLKVDKLRALRKECMRAFSNVRCSLVMIPSYTSGQIALMVCGDENVALDMACREVDVDARYYSAQIHSASFVLPKWASDQVYGE